MKKEYPVGEEFQMGLRKLKCVETPLNECVCEGCIFEGSRNCIVTSLFVGECFSANRMDEKNVRFILVE